MELSPFVFEESGVVKNSAGVHCFDEASPCVLEQISGCVIQLTNDQSKYVPWLVCMDTEGESTANAEKCCSQHGIDYSAVSNCQTTRGTDVLNQLVKHDAGVSSTPTVKVNGKTVGGRQGPTYKSVKSAICKADPSLTACSKNADVVV